MLSSPLHAGIWCGLGLHTSFACCHNHCGIVCAAVLLFPRATAFLYSSTASGSYTRYASPCTLIPEAGRRGWGIYIPLKAAFLQSKRNVFYNIKFISMIKIQSYGLLLWNPQSRLLSSLCLSQA